MTVICLKKCCDESILLLPERVDTSVEDDSFVLLMGYTVEYQTTEYRITEGREYTVYGILIYKNQIRYLIQDDGGMPVFCPEELLHIQKANVYWDWKIKTFIVEGIPLFLAGFPAEWTYDDLINLVRRKKYAIEQFLEYKEYTERYCDI